MPGASMLPETREIAGITVSVAADDPYWKRYLQKPRKKPVRIKRSEDTRVLMSEEEYEGLMETIHLLSSPANASRLRSALAQAKAGKLQEHELDE